MELLANEILREKWASISGINEPPPLPGAFDYEARFDLFSSEAWALAKAIVEEVPIASAARAIPMCHATLHDGSEQDLWIHYGSELRIDNSP